MERQLRSGGPYRKRGSACSARCILRASVTASLLREYDDTVKRCKTSILSEDPALWWRITCQRVRSLCAGFVSTADPFDRAELVTRHCEAKRKQKRPRFSFSMFIAGKEKVQDGWKPVGC